jgi:uncharacterized protein (TIGR02271 family)
VNHHQENDMERVLIGVFDSKQQMEAACQELRDCGIPSDRVQIQAGNIDEKLKSDLLARNRASDKADTGFFDRLFGGLDDDKQRSGDYAEAVRRGSCAVVIDGVEENRIPQAVEVLERNGAFDIDERASQWREGGWKGYDAGAPALSAAEIEDERKSRNTSRSRTSDSTKSTGASQMAASGAAGTSQMTGASAQQNTRIPVVEEQLKVGKREVQRGGVRIYARTSERPVEETVTLREERARVERRPVNRAATGEELGNAFEERSIELSETAEEPVVSKTARVVEEVDVGKEVSSRTETIKDTVRRRDVEVEKSPGSTSGTSRKGSATRKT